MCDVFLLRETNHFFSDITCKIFQNLGTKSAPMPPMNKAAPKKPPARPMPSMQSNINQAKQTMNTMNQVNQGMKQMGITPQQGRLSISCNLLN